MVAFICKKGPPSLSLLLPSQYFLHFLLQQILENNVILVTESSVEY